MKKLAVVAAFCFAATGAMAQDNHDHSHDHGHDHDHGEPKDLGTTTVAGMKLKVFQLGDLTPEEGVFEVQLPKDAPKPKAVRMWLGVATAAGSVKARAEGEGPHYMAHVEVPKTMPKDAQIWIEVQTADNKRHRLSFDLKKK